MLSRHLDARVLVALCLLLGAWLGYVTASDTSPAASSCHATEGGHWRTLQQECRFR